MAQQCFKSLKRNGTQSGTNETVSDMWRTAECSGFFTCFLSMPNVSDVIELIETKVESSPAKGPLTVLHCLRPLLRLSDLRK